MYEQKSIEVARAMLLFDVLMTAMAYALSVHLTSQLWTHLPIDTFAYFSIVPLIMLFIVGFLSHFGGYKSPCRVSMFQYAWAALRAIALTIGTLLFILVMLHIDYISRTVVISFAAIELVCIITIRAAFKRYQTICARDLRNASRVLIIGTGERAKELSKNLRAQSEWGIDVVGHLDPDPTRIGTTILGAPVLGTVEDIGRILKANVIDEVVIAITRSMLTDAEPIAHACEEEGIKLRFMADLFNLEAARTNLIQLGSIPLLTLETVAQDEIQLWVKRGFDLLLTIAALPLVIVVMAIIAIAIKLDSPGPIFFVQQRVGLKKRLFPMLKFRSMHQNAEEMLAKIEHLNEAQGPIFKMKNDPRITLVGKWLRITSMDELPQLLNVLAGHMSLVGPRPMSIRDVDLFDRGIQRKRFSVKPGLTCLWQISGRSELPFSKWLELDLKYIENWSLWLDLKILVKTIPVVLLFRGAV
jgi:exopolysaccharide biosynthesis polyprenyl glycosylphosphotransferase